MTCGGTRLLKEIREGESLDARRGDRDPDFERGWVILRGVWRPIFISWQVDMQCSAPFLRTDLGGWSPTRVCGAEEEDRQVNIVSRSAGHERQRSRDYGKV